MPPSQRQHSVFPVDGQGSRERRAWLPRALKLTGCYGEKPAALTSSGPPSSLQDELLGWHRLQLYLFPVSSSQPLDLGLRCQGALRQGQSAAIPCPSWAPPLLLLSQVSSAVFLLFFLPQTCGCSGHINSRNKADKIKALLNTTLVSGPGEGLGRCCQPVPRRCHT